MVIMIRMHERLSGVGCGLDDDEKDTLTMSTLGGRRPHARGDEKGKSMGLSGDRWTHRTAASWAAFPGTFYQDHLQGVKYEGTGA